jgi:hypothetical protein
MTLTASVARIGRGKESKRLPKMFLSRLISHCEPDGSLVLDLQKEAGASFRCGPFSRGMPWQKWSDSGWVDTTPDPDVQLVNRAHAAHPGIPVLEYLQDWPQDLIGLLYPIWFGQAQILQLCARHGAARDLVWSNTVLLWLIAARIQEDPAWRPDLAKLLSLTQREILGRVLDLTDVRSEQVRFLRKVVIMDGDQRALEEICRAVADINAVSRMHHWRRLPSNLLHLLPGPLLHRLHWLAGRVGQVGERWEVDHILGDRLPLLTDTSRLLEPYPLAVSTHLLAAHGRNFDDLRRLHNLLVLMLNSEPEATGTRDRFLGPPPIPSDSRFQAITTLGALREEGRTMRHCVATRARDVLAGHCYIYRVFLPNERGTLQVGIQANGYVVDEFRLADNAEPSLNAWDEVELWVEYGWAARSHAKTFPVPAID